MTVIPEFQESLDATLETVDGRRVVADYGRPERTHLAVRKVVGLTEAAYGVVAVEGSGRVEATDGATVGPVPHSGGEGGRVLAADGGSTVAEATVYHAGERLLCFCPPECTGVLAERIRRVAASARVREATGEFGVFGIHGPEATEKVASVLHDATVPDERLTFVRGRLGEAGVTVVRTDAPTGEEGYEVVCASEDAREAFDILLNQGLNAAPFGYRTWETLTLEAGTPLFAPDLRGVSPGTAGVGSADAGRWLVGLAPEAVPDAGAGIAIEDETVGRVTRAVESPSLEEPIAFGLVERSPDGASVGVDGGRVPAAGRELPFLEGSDRSGRIPPGP